MDATKTAMHSAKARPCRKPAKIRALDQLHRALELAPDVQSAPAILSQVAAVEAQLGDGETALTHYASAWLLSKVQSA